MALLAAVIVALGWLWVRALHSALVTADSSTQSSAVRGASLPFARYGLRGTLAARFFLYQRREPLSVTYWAIVVVIMGAASVSTVTTPRYIVAILLSAGFAGAFIGIFHANSIGLTGPAFSLEATALTGPRAVRAYFSGQNIALGLVAVPLLALASFAIAAVARHPVDGFLGLAVDLAGIGAGLAVSNILTAGLAYPVEKRAGNPSPRPADGYSGHPALGALVCLGSVAVAVTPVVLASVFTGSDPAAIRMPLIVLAAAAYGFALAWAGVRVASAMAARQLPELCQVALRSRLSPGPHLAQLPGRADLPGDAAGARRGVEGVRVRGELAQQRAERPPVRVGVQAGQHVPLGLPQLPVEVGELLTAGRGGHDAPGPAVGRVGPPLDEPGALEVVEQVRHHRAVDPEVLGQLQLAAYAAAGGGGEYLIAARPAGQPAERRVRRLHVAAEDHPERPAQVIAQRPGARQRRAGRGAGLRPGSGVHAVQRT